jgi:hypothetical protein
MAAIFVLYTHFVGNIELPNTASTTPEGAALAISMNKLEPLFLENILGYKMKKDLYTAMDVVTPPTSGIWFDLCNGKEYTDRSGKLQKWNGWKTIGLNPIANYIYTIIQAERISSTTGVGEQASAFANGIRASIDRKISEAWNEMVGFNINMHEFIYANKADYPDYLGEYHDQNCNIFFRKSNILGI